MTRHIVVSKDDYFTDRYSDNSLIRIDKTSRSSVRESSKSLRRSVSDS